MPINDPVHCTRQVHRYCIRVGSRFGATSIEAEAIVWHAGRHGVTPYLLMRL